MFILLIIFSFLVVFILLPVSFIAFIIGLIKPSLFGFALKSAATQKNISLLFSAVSALTIGVLITDVITFGGKNITIDVPAQKKGIPSITPSVVCLPVPALVLRGDEFVFADYIDAKAPAAGKACALLC